MGKVIKGKNDLATVHPELLAEWDYEKNGEVTPDEVAVGSHDKVWWRCPNDEIKQHSYRAGVHVKVLAGIGKGCSYCYGSEVLEGLNDLATTDKEIADLWDHTIEVYTKGKVLKPNNVSRGSSYKVFWKCKQSDCKHSYQASIANVVRGKRCSFCDGKKVLPGFNDLKSTHPELLAEWDYEKNNLLGLFPNRHSYGSRTKVWWKCPNDTILKHSYYARIADKKVGKGCPYCCGKEVLAGLNDLESRAPEIALDWEYGLNKKKPNEVLKGSGEEAFWICRNEGVKPHSYPLPIINRVQGHKCPYCHGKKVKPGLNDICTTAKFLLADWDYDENRKMGLYPENFSKGSSQVVFWKCKNMDVKEHSYQLMISDRYHGVGCPYCTGRKVLKGLNDIETTDKWIRYEWDYEKNSALGLTPDSVSRGQHITVWWKCQNGDKPHSYPAMIKSRIVDGQKCGICHGLRIERGINDLVTTDLEIAKEWDYVLNNGLVPEEFTRASNEIVFWKCLKNKKHGSYSAMIARRTLKETGCPLCNESHGEKKIRAYLEKHGIFLKHKTLLRIEEV